MKKIVIGTLAAALVLGGSIGLGINHGYADDDDNEKTVQVKKKTIGTKKGKSCCVEKSERWKS